MTQKQVILLDILARVLFPLVLFVNPYLGSLVSILLDSVDYHLLVNIFRLSRDKYEQIDKWLDFYWYVLILVFVINIEMSLKLKLVFVLLFMFRLIGQGIFALAKKEKILIIFPNIVEPLFWVFLISPNWLYLKIEIVVLMLWFLKIFHEYVVHIVKYSPTTFLMKKKRV